MIADRNAEMCLSDVQFQDFLAGRMDVQQTERVADHIEACEQCQTKLDSIEDADVSVDRLVNRPAEIAFTDEPQCDLLVSNAAKEMEGLASQEVDEQSEQELGRRCGEYELLGQLGQGGMGTVYRARHTTTGADVAIKRVHTDRNADPVTIERFRREMVALGKLDHQNIVRAIDAGEDEGVHFLVMEYIDGVDLAQLIRQRGPLSVPDAAAAIRQAALGVEYIHRNGRIHRDIKPSNLILSTEGTVKLLDLGLARVDECPLYEPTATVDMNERWLEDLTRTHQVMGTLEYMSPEQASDSRSVDFRADLYSLGCTLFKLLTGQSPLAFHASSASLKGPALRFRKAPDLHEMGVVAPKAFCELLERMLAIDLEERPESAAEIAEQLEPFTTSVGLADLITENQNALVTAPNSISPASRNPANEPSRKWPSAVLNSTVTKVASMFAITSCFLAFAITTWSPHLFSTQVIELESTRWFRLTATEIVSRDGATFTRQPDGSYLVEGESSTEDSYYVTIDTETEGIAAIRLDLIPDESLPQWGPGRHATGSFHLGEIALESNAGNDGDKLSRFEFKSALATYQYPTRPIENAIDGDPGTSWHTFGQLGQRQAATFYLEKPLPAGTRLKIELKNQSGDRIPKTIGRFALSAMRFPLTADEERNLAESAVVEPGEKLNPFFAQQDQGKLRTVDADVVWNTHEQKRIVDVAFSQSGKYIISCGMDHKVRVRNQEEQELHVFDSHSDNVLALACWKDSRVLTAGRDGQVLLWDLEDGRMIQKMEGDPVMAWCAAISPDGSTVAAAGLDHRIYVWDSRSGKLIRSIAGHTDAVDGLTFSPSGDLLASCSKDMTIRLWDVKSGKLRSIGGAPRRLRSVAFSPDGQMVASGCGDGTVRIWSLMKGRSGATILVTRNILHGHSRDVRSVCWNPDGNRLVSSGFDHSVRLWSAAGSTFKTETVLPFDSNRIERAVFQPDGQSILACGNDGSLRVWNATQGTERSSRAENNGDLAKTELNRSGVSREGL